MMIYMERFVYDDFFGYFLAYVHHDAKDSLPVITIISANRLDRSFHFERQSSSLT